MSSEDPPKEEPDAPAEDAPQADGAGDAEVPAQGSGESAPAPEGADDAEASAAASAGNRFGGTEGEPPPDEPEKRNLKNKKIIASLEGELDDFGDLYDDDEDGDDDSKSKKKKKKKRKKKKPKVNPVKKHQGKLIFLSIVAFLGYGYWYLSQPTVGSIGFGMCKVFLERWVQYPDELRISTVTEFRDSARIWYVQTDSFGQYRMEQMQCYYANTPEKGFHLEKIELNRREMDPQLVEGFNKSIPAIRMTEEYLHIPWPLPDKLQNMQTDFYDGIL